MATRGLWMFPSTRVSKSRYSPNLRRVLRDDPRLLATGLLLVRLRIRRNRLHRAPRLSDGQRVQTLPIQRKVTRKRLLVVSSREGGRERRCGPPPHMPLTVHLASFEARPALSRSCRFSTFATARHGLSFRLRPCRRLRPPRLKAFLDRLNRNSQHRFSIPFEPLFLAAKGPRQSESRATRRRPSTASIKQTRGLHDSFKTLANIRLLNPKTKIQIRTLKRRQACLNAR